MPCIKRLYLSQTGWMTPNDQTKHKQPGKKGFAEGGSLSRNWRSAEIRRSKIAESAGRCFLRYGFAETTLDQIAAESGIVKQTIYNYFETKELLFKATVEYLLVTFSIEFDTAWFQLEVEEFLVKVAQIQLEKLQTKDMTDFLQLAVKESRTFPELQDVYAEYAIEPMVNFISTYLTSRTGCDKSIARTFAWCYRNAITGYGTLSNLDALVSHKPPVKKLYLRIAAKLFADALAAETLEKKNITQLRPVEPVPEADSAEDELRKFFSNTAKTRFSRNQAAILAAAVTTFSAHGFADANMEQVAIAAGVSKQTVYTRFKSKDELFKAMCQETLPRLQSTWLENSSRATQKPTLHELCRKLFDETRRPWVRDFFQVVIGESKAFPQEANQAILHLYDFGRQPIEEYIREQPNCRESDCTSLSIAVQGVIGSYVLLRHIYKVGRSPRIDELNVIDFVAQLIGSSKKSGRRFTDGARGDGARGDEAQSE